MLNVCADKYIIFRNVYNEHILWTVRRSSSILGARLCILFPRGYDFSLRAYVDRTCEYLCAEHRIRSYFYPDKNERFGRSR